MLKSIPSQNFIKEPKKGPRNCFGIISSYPSASPDAYTLLGRKTGEFFLWSPQTYEMVVELGMILFQRHSEFLYQKGETKAGEEEER